MYSASKQKESEVTDRELLELAAKAAGGIATDGLGECFDIERGQDWNPLTDDGDALRLAVKLGLSMWVGEAGADVECDQNKIKHITQMATLDLAPCAAARRAIVRAAAEIGKAMESA